MIEWRRKFAAPWRGWAVSGKIVQQTLEGISVSAMPRVRTTDGHLLDWDRDSIFKQMLRETKLSANFGKHTSIHSLSYLRL